MSNQKNKLIKQLKLELGSQMIDVELDKEHYELAIELAIEKMQQISDGGVEESILFITVQEDMGLYQLPDEVKQVRHVHRRGLGHAGQTITFDPYEASFMNMYILNNKQTGGLATWELAHQHLETMGRLLGAEVPFIFNRSNKTIHFQRKFRRDEELMLTVDNVKPEIAILTDGDSLPFVRKYALGKCKVMLGEAREKFATIAGPNGGTQLNGSQLKAEGIQMMQEAEEDLKNLQTGNAGLPVIIG
tara:strand:- start:1045 stop:1782 length:738 start_codon:yes stop_codon:yes gene_type:complete